MGYIKTKEKSKKRTLALRDYWPFWRSNLESASCGKMVFLDSDNLAKTMNNNSKEDKNENEVNNDGDKKRVVLVFDDNVEYHDAHIIDAREICREEEIENSNSIVKPTTTVTSKPIPFQQIFDKYLFRAEPFFAITAPKTYFMDIVRRAILLHHNSRKG